jgi:WD40 repeat protein
MSGLFVSHSSSDQAATTRVSERLRAEGIEALFVDFDPEQGIPAGRNWELELYAQVRKADALVFLSSPASVASQWCFAEVALVRLLGKPVFPIVIEAGPRHPLLGDTQHIDLAREGDSGFQRLWSGLRQAGLDPHASFAWDPTRTPYPGLAAFTEQDAAVFFGRESETERLLELLQPGLQGHGRFVVIVGPSGSGKSSLVRAGLLPRLGRLSHRWLVVPRLVPGSQPIRQLARSLAKAFKDREATKPPAELAARLAGGVPALVEVVEELRDFATGEPTSLLLVIDQAEELATLAGEAERAAFLDLLHGAVHTAAGVWVLAIVRAEFLGTLLQQPGAGQFVDETLLVSPLDRSRLFAVIEGPAARAGLQFAPGLVGRLVEDARGGDALPLLAFTLRELAEQAGPDGQLTTEAYEASAGVVGALRAQADRTAAALAKSGHGELAVLTLTNLATVTGQGEPTRRRVARSTLTTAEDEIIQAFIDARLLVSRDEQGEAVVEVAHEALLRQWPPLLQAIEARREELRRRAELERWVQDWDRAARQDSYLVGGERLEAAQRWAVAHSQDLLRLPGASEFLARSALQHKLNMQLRSEAVANRALVELNRDPELATLLAISAIEEIGPSPRATLALSTALATCYILTVLRSHEGSVRAVTFGPDGTRLATASADGTARVWDLASGTELHTLRHQSEVAGVAFSPDGTRLATASADSTARVWDLASGTELHILRHPGAGVWGVAFSPNGRRLATASAEGRARVWDLASGTELHTFWHRGTVLGVVFSPDGSRLACASIDGTARVWDLASGAELQTFRHEDAVVEVSFSPDGSRLASASADGRARVWDLASGTELQTLRHDSDVLGVAFSPDGSRLATASDLTAQVWDVASGTELHTLLHDSDVLGVAFSPDGTRLATADGIARVWVLASSAELHVLRGHEDSVKGVAFSPDSSRLATASSDGTARVWDLASGTELQTLRHGGWVEGVAFSSDGDRLATATDGTARVWDLASGAELHTLPHEGQVAGVAFSPDGDRLATAANRTARVWDVASAAELHILRDREDVQGVVFSPDSTRLATASSDGTARVWAVRSDGMLLIRARTRVSRRLNNDERRMAGLLY